MMLAACLLNYAGFSLLCLAMERHAQDLLKRRLSSNSRRLLRVLGWSALGLSLASVWPMQRSVAWVEWTAGLMASGVLLVWLIPYRPRLALGLAGGALLGGPVALFWQL
jgi:hypothetical protein